MAKHYDEALGPLLEATSRAPGWRGGHLYLAATYVRLGELDKARAAANAVLQLEPGWTIGRIGRADNSFRRPQDARHFFSALAKAGLPE